MLCKQKNRVLSTISKGNVERKYEIGHLFSVGQEKKIFDEMKEVKKRIGLNGIAVGKNESTIEDIERAIHNGMKLSDKDQNIYENYKFYSKGRMPSQREIADENKKELENSIKRPYFTVYKQMSPRITETVIVEPRIESGDKQYYNITMIKEKIGSKGRDYSRQVKKNIYDKEELIKNLKKYSKKENALYWNNTEWLQMIYPQINSMSLALVIMFGMQVKKKFCI